MTNIKSHYAFSIDTKIDDLGWPWTATSSNFLEFRVISQIWEATTVSRMSIDPHCSRLKVLVSDVLRYYWWPFLRQGSTIRIQWPFSTSIRESISVSNSIRPWLLNINKSYIVDFLQVSSLGAFILLSCAYLYVRYAFFFLWLWPLVAVEFRGYDKKLWVPSGLYP